MNCELDMILNKVKGKFICEYNGESKVFSSKEEFEKSEFEKNCRVSAISTRDGIIILELEKWNSPTADANSDWVKEHEKQFESEISFL